MRFDVYVKVVLTVIAGCLLFLVVRGTDLVPLAHADDLGKLDYAREHGVGIACSADGRYVFVAGTRGVIRSDDFGRIGSWEKIIKEQ